MGWNWFNQGLLHTHMSGTLKNTPSTSGPCAPAVWQLGVELIRWCGMADHPGMTIVLKRSKSYWVRCHRCWWFTSVWKGWNSTTQHDSEILASRYSCHIILAKRSWAKSLVWRFRFGGSIADWLHVARHSQVPGSDTDLPIARSSGGLEVK